MGAENCDADDKQRPIDGSSMGELAAYLLTMSSVTPCLGSVSVKTPE